jgi:hypothetical protein
MSLTVECFMSSLDLDDFLKLFRPVIRTGDNSAFQRWLGPFLIVHHV